MERALEAQGGEHFVLRLYVAGMTPRSTLAITNIKKICEENLKGRYTLEVIDLYERPALAVGEQILAAPTLLKKLPLPLRRFIGTCPTRRRSSWDWTCGRIKRVRKLSERATGQS